MTDLPISVWPTAQASPVAQRKGRYLPGSLAHPAKMLPAIARTAISEYSSPGDIVLDPMCGVGTTLVEAVHLRRNAFGVEYEPSWAELARANLVHASSQGATGRSEVACADARDLLKVVSPELRGAVALVLTSPPYGSSVHGHVRTKPGSGVRKSDYRYSNDPANLAQRPVDELLEAFGQILAGCRELLLPGGFVVLTVRPFWHDGRLVDFPAMVTRTAEAAGLVLYERNVALLAG
ncbi:MAG TPA: DNA methyltransferase, partial [Acidimicrobiales bacterium]|nr:DNA methyltransferase [Acidimicrobiales bacterium]